MPSAGWREVAAALDVESGRPDDPGNSGEGHGRAGPSGPRRADGGTPATTGKRPMTADDSTPGRGKDGDEPSDEQAVRMADEYGEAFARLAATELERHGYALRQAFVTVERGDVLADGPATVRRLRERLDEARAALDEVEAAHPATGERPSDE